LRKRGWKIGCGEKVNFCGEKKYIISNVRQLLHQVSGFKPLDFAGYSRMKS
jgi:hypothetical protein